MSDLRFNAYRFMWIFAFFDLPVTSKLDRKRAARFRKDLEKDGFTMLQFSVYVRYCPSKENADVHIKHVRLFLPPSGKVSVLCVTDKQYAEMINFFGKIEEANKKMPQQLELF